MTFKNPSLPSSNEFCDCPKGGAWLTREAAVRRLKKLKANPSRKKTPQRVYECEQGVWHLTSQEGKR